MKIVVLDGYAANPGDLAWEPLERLGDLAVYDRTAPEQTVERARRAGVVLTNKTVLSRPIVEALPDLRYIGVLATGYNVIDMAAAADRNIIVTNVPAYSTESVAEMVFAHLLNLAFRPAEHSASVMAGDWVASKDFSYWKHPLVELHGLTIGIVGLGRIGRAVARIAQAFGMKVIAFNRTRRPDVPPDVDIVSLDELFRRSDVVTLHCQLSEETHHLVNAGKLDLMKPSAFLINTGRGPLVDEQALADALNAGRIAGAAVDVLSTEPPHADNPLLHAENLCITPHIAWATRAARERLMRIAAENVAAFLEGRPQNVVT